MKPWEWLALVAGSAGVGAGVYWVATHRAAASPPAPSGNASQLAATLQQLQAEEAALRQQYADLTAQIAAAQATVRHLQQTLAALQAVGA